MTRFICVDIDTNHFRQKRPGPDLELGGTSLWGGQDTHLLREPFFSQTRLDLNKAKKWLPLHNRVGSRTFLVKLDYI